MDDDLMSLAKHAAEPQPKPTGRGELVTPVLLKRLRQRNVNGQSNAIIRGIESRDAFGAAKYGDGLRTNNGRDPAVDAWQEALDLLQYLTQMEMEGCKCPLALRRAIYTAHVMAECIP